MTITSLAVRKPQRSSCKRPRAATKSNRWCSRFLKTTTLRSPTRTPAEKSSLPRENHLKLPPTRRNHTPTVVEEENRNKHKSSPQDPMKKTSAPRHRPRSNTSLRKDLKRSGRCGLGRRWRGLESAYGTERRGGGTRLIECAGRTRSGGAKVEGGDLFGTRK